MPFVFPHLVVVLVARKGVCRANTEVIVNTITIFVSWVPLVLLVCGAVRRALARLQFFCIWFALLASQVCGTQSVAPTCK